MTQSDTAIRIVARDREKSNVVIIFDLDGRSYEKVITPSNFAKPDDTSTDQIRARIISHAAALRDKLIESPKLIARALKYSWTIDTTIGRRALIELQNFDEKGLAWQYIVERSSRKSLSIEFNHWAIFLSFLDGAGLSNDARHMIDDVTQKDIERSARCIATQSTLSDFMDELPIEIDHALRLYYKNTPGLVSVGDAT